MEKQSRIGLGCMGMSEFYGATDDAQSMETLETAFANGVTLFDTADSYGAGHNEELLGRFLRGKRKRCASPPSSGWCARRAATNGASTIPRLTSAPRARRR